MHRQGIGFHDDQYKFLEKVAREKKISFSQALREVLHIGIETVKKGWRKQGVKGA